MRRANRIAVATVLGIGLVCLGGGYGAIYGVFGRYASHRDEELAAARREGIPIEPRDLKRTVPKESNAAPYYVQASEILASDAMKGPVRAISQATMNNASTVEIEAADRAMASLNPVLDRIERGSALPYCDFDRDWSLGPNVLFPEFARLKTASKALAIRAESASRRGDWQAALRDLRTGYRLAQHAGEEPILIGMLVGVSYENITHTAFRRVLSEHGRDPAFLAAASRLQSDIGPLPNLRHALGGEVVMGRATLPMIESGASIGLGDGHSSSGEREPFFAERAFFKSAPVQGAFEVKLIQHWRQAYRDLPIDPADWEGGLVATSKLDAALAADKSFANRANQFLMPVFAQSAMAVGKVVAERRLNATALRLLSLRTQTGEFPKALPKSWGQEATDPFTHQPFHYRREGVGFRLWSVSSDGIDDGGFTPQEKKGSNRDQVVRYPIPPRPTKSLLAMPPSGPGGQGSGGPALGQNFDY